MTLQIPANDHGQIRIFATDSNPEDIATVLGAELDRTFVDVVCIADLGEMTLTDYIEQGYDMPTDEVEKQLVNAITGYAILVLSRATGGVATMLPLGAGVRHVTTYSPDARIVVPQALPDGSAKGTIPGPAGKPPKSDARIGGMVATVVLLLMFALVGVMIWIAG